MPLADLPITSNSPTAILFLDEKSIADNDPLATIKRKWPNININNNTD